ncbi:MAG: hydroxyacid dehydrogenase [Eubacteriaceae bacterium]
MISKHRHKVLITNPIICQKAIDLLIKIADIKIIEPTSSEETVINAVKDVDAILLRTIKITKKIIKSANNLKIISRHGVGIDSIDVEEATQRGIIVTNTPQANAEAVSEYTFALILAFFRKIPNGFSMIQKHLWDRKKLIQRELYHKTIGIIGLGNIGSRVAQKAKAFEMEILGFDPFISSKNAIKMNVELVNFTEILKRSNIITLHTPLTYQTKHLINKKELDLMKKDVLLVNTARGGLINEIALVKHLKNNKRSGACLDSFEEEPLSNKSELPSLDNVILTPHVAAQSKESMDRVGLEAAKNIVAVLEGKIPESICNKKVLEH